MRRISIVKMGILPKAICTFNAIPVKISGFIFTEIETYLKIHMGTLKTPTSQTTVSRKSSSVGVMIPGLKLYTRSVV